MKKRCETHKADPNRISRLTTMGEFAASIAHEVNQPLMAIANQCGEQAPSMAVARSPSTSAKLQESC